MIGNFIKNISGTELIIIAGILTMVFGRKFVIGLGKTAGETLKEMKKIKSSITDAAVEDEPKHA